MFVLAFSIGSLNSRSERQTIMQFVMVYSHSFSIYVLLFYFLDIFSLS